MKINTTGRIFLFILSYYIIVLVFTYVGGEILEIDYTSRKVIQTSKQQLGVSVFSLVGTFLVIALYMKFVDKEPFIKLGFQTKKRLIEFMIGIIIGLVIMLIGYLLLTYFGEIFFIKSNFDFMELLISIILFTIVAITEETLIRGYVLKNLMSSFNKYTALITSSILFSLMHGLNPNIDFFSLFSLFLAGIFLGISYIYTKNLWFPIALHLSWNLFQTLLGFNVSGHDTYSIIEFGINENNLINGGTFGFEGSFLSIIAEIIIIVSIILYYNRKKPTSTKANINTNLSL